MIREATARNAATCVLERVQWFTWSLGAVLFRFIDPEDEQASHDATVCRRPGHFSTKCARGVLDEPESSTLLLFIP